MTNMYPQSKEIAGSHYWAVLFNIGAQYPNSPTRDDKLNTNNLIRSIIGKFTCQSCVQHAFEFMAENSMRLDSKESLMKWLCELKNNSNVHEGKETIDCNQFVMTNLNKDGGCQSCAITPIKAPSYTFKAQEEIPPKPTSFQPDAQFESVWNWQTRYPSLKRNLTIQNDNPQVNASMPTPPVVSAALGGPDQNNMQSMGDRYPSLSGFDDDFGVKKEEELDGILKALDGIYAIPAGFVGLKPHEMNLAYTPEFTTNIVTLIMQMYLNNFGSLITTFGSSVLLFAISLVAKNNIGTYDKLYLQNVVGSLLFHCLNFINPRIKDEVLPQAHKFIDGLMTMNFDKIKSSVLHGYQTNEEITNNELMAMAKGQDGIIDMEKLKVPKMSYMGGQGHAFGASTVRDLQNAGQSRYDSRIGGGIGGGLGGGFGASKDDIMRLYNQRGGGSSIRDYTYGMSNPQPNYGRLGQMDDSYSYILDNNLL